MENLKKSLRNLSQSALYPPLFLLALCIVCYGLLIPWLGYYWDGWIMGWIADKLGPAGLTRYFETNRPVWGWIYQVTTALVGDAPWQWQVFGIVTRWINAVVLWWLCVALWPKHRLAALIAGMIFVVYPGFDQQYIANVYGHYFIVFSIFLGSLLLTYSAHSQEKRRWLFTTLALILSAFNLFAVEYFYFLEIVRPFVIWKALDNRDSKGKKRWVTVGLETLPYLLVFAAASVWRAFIFTAQTYSYNLSLPDQFRANPLETIGTVVGTVANDFWVAAIRAWGLVFSFPQPDVMGVSTTLLYVGVVAVGLAISVIFMQASTHDQDKPGGDKKSALEMIGAGLVITLVAGIPFLMTDLPVRLIFPYTRFLLPFIPGVCLLFAGLLQLLPLRRWIVIAIVGVFIGLSAGRQFQIANDYRRDWNIYKSLFWQMTWRIPALEPGTAILSNELPIGYSTDNSLTAPLNWIYASENRSHDMSYVFYYPSVRLDLALKGLEPNLPIYQNYYAAVFNGSTSQIVAIKYSPPGCLRVLDPLYDPDNKMLTEMEQDMSKLSKPELTLSADAQHRAVVPTDVFGEEPGENWCYYFEKADRARLEQDWERVAALGNEAFHKKDYPNDPMERIPFIEGYAHTGDWERASELTDESMEITPMMRPILCKVWQRIDDTVEETKASQEAIGDARNALACE